MSAEPPAPDSAAGTPRWVKVFTGVGVLLVLVFVALLILGGNHGPGRHGLPAPVAAVA